MHAQTTTGFAHQRLDAFHISMELTLGVEEAAALLPRGYADLKDQVRRAAAATTRAITEGANRCTPRDKRARFVLARGECGECDAALQMMQGLGLGRPESIVRLRVLADRVGAMLTGLIRRKGPAGPYTSRSCSASIACAAAKRATGTRNGEQET